MHNSLSGASLPFFIEKLSLFMYSLVNAAAQLLVL